MEKPVWTFPSRGPQFWLHGNRKNKTCWDCQHIRVAGFPNRRCDLHRELLIWTANPTEEAEEYSVTPKGKTLADVCEDYTLFHGPFLSNIVRKAMKIKLSVELYRETQTPTQRQVP